MDDTSILGRYYRNDPQSYDLHQTTQNIAAPDLLPDSDVAVKIFKRKIGEQSTKESPILVEIEIGNHDPQEFFLYIAKDGNEICAMELGSMENNNRSLCFADESMFHFGDNSFTLSIYSTASKQLLLQTKAHLFFTEGDFDEVIVDRKNRFEKVFGPIIRKQKGIALTGSLLILAWFFAHRAKFPVTVEFVSTTNDYGSGDGGGDNNAVNIFPDGRLDYYKLHSSSHSVPIHEPLHISTDTDGLELAPIVRYSLFDATQKVLGHSYRYIMSNIPRNPRFVWTLLGLTISLVIAINQRHVIDREVEKLLKDDGVFSNQLNDGTSIIGSTSSFVSFAQNKRFGNIWKRFTGKNNRNFPVRPPDELDMIIPKPTHATIPVSLLSSKS